MSKAVNQQLALGQSRCRLAIMAVVLLALSPLTARAAGAGGAITPAAPCDGTSDRTLVIQAAVNSAVALGSNTVHISAGTGACIISASIIVPSNVTIRGDGRGRSVIRFAPGMLGLPMLRNSDTLAGNTGISLVDLTLDGNSAKQAPDLTATGFLCEGCQNIYIHGVEVANVTGTGIFLSGLGLAIGPLQVSDLYVHDNSFNGVQFSHAIRRSVVTGVIAENNGGVGVLFDSSEMNAANIFAKGNGGRIGGGDPAIYMRNITSSTFSNIVAEDNQNTGVQVNGCVSCVFSGVRSQSNGKRKANTYDDLAFDANPFRAPHGYGETSFVAMSSVLVGSQLQTGDATVATERYGIYFGDVVNAHVKVRGVMFQPSVTGNVRLPAAIGADFLID